MYKVAICIPTYNRSPKIFNLVSDLLSMKFDWLQVVVSDNCSTDDTVFKLKQITDPRLFLYENVENEGAISNYINAISKSDAAYSIFMTDKDSINIEYINRVVEELFKYKPVAGYLKYAVATPAKTIIAPRLFKLFIAGYRCIHPSGYFFETSNLKKRLLDRSLREKLFVTPFPFELLLSRCSCDGDIAILPIPLFTQESPAEYRTIKSHTYTATQGNLYFTPPNRLATYLRFIDDIEENNIGKIDSLLTKIRLLYWFVSVSTLGFAKIISDVSFCEHYRIQEHKVSYNEIIETLWSYFSTIGRMKKSSTLLKFVFFPISASILVKFFYWKWLKRDTAII